jgi:Recombination endonuclease VII
MYAELMRKECSECNEIKSVSDFYVRKLSPDGLAYICKPCDLRLHKEYCEKNRDKIREQRKEFRRLNKTRLSISKNRAKCSPEKFKALFEEQRGCCAICGLHQSKMRRRIAIDHNHETNEIRGLLCDNCNRCLGLLKDSQEVLQNALNYLSKHKK